MIWKFKGFTLDKMRAELVGPDGPVHVERYPLEVLVQLIENAERVVTRDDLITAVWDGRIVSDATISTAVKQARKAVGDTGAEQAIIRTVHGRGFRFVAELEAPARPAVPLSSAPEPKTTEADLTPGRGRPSVAVIRFLQFGEAPAHASLSDAFPAELISNLSRIRWLHVIARGSSFRFDPREIDPSAVGQHLAVRYIVTGAIEMVGEMMTISVEILSTETGALVWSDRFGASLSEIHEARRNIIASVVTALELSIPEHEAVHSRHLNAAEFDAWSHFHLGLSHIFKFNKGDNLIAAQHFNSALALDPDFARAHAGLSFTHWQNAFMQFGQDRKSLIDNALTSASQALEIDATDPFSNFNMGRARWLQGDIEGSRNWLDRALRINPNFAQCHYNKGLILTLDGAAEEAQSSALTAMSLSPLDPLYYGMLGVRAMCHITRDEFDEACHLAVRAMQSPGAHFYIALIAAVAHELKGDTANALRWREHALRERPSATAEMFLTAFPFRRLEMRQKMTGALHRLDLP